VGKERVPQWVESSLRVSMSRMEQGSGRRHNAQLAKHCVHAADVAAVRVITLRTRHSRRFDRFRFVNALDCADRPPLARCRSSSHRLGGQHPPGDGFGSRVRRGLQPDRSHRAVDTKGEACCTGCWIFWGASTSCLRAAAGGGGWGAHRRSTPSPRYIERAARWKKKKGGKGKVNRVLNASGAPRTGFARRAVPVSRLYLCMVLEAGYGRWTLVRPSRSNSGESRVEPRPSVMDAAVSTSRARVHPPGSWWLACPRGMCGALAWLGSWLGWRTASHPAQSSPLRT